MTPPTARTPARRRFELDPNREPWEKQPHESRQAYANYVVYRDLGPRRSLAKAAPDTGKSLATITDQSKKYRWVERCDAYDVYMEERYREARESELMAAERREAQLGTTMTVLAARRIMGSQQHGIPALNPAEWDAATAAKMAEVGIRTRRLAQGQPTDILRGHHTITAYDLKKAVEGVYEILMGYVAEDLRPRAASEVELFFETGRVPE
jgi:hypothetical protein